MASEIPQWFWNAVETEADSAAVEVDECDVVYRWWGDRDKPPLLLIHGMNAHSRWWDFIAPQLIDEYFVVAMDLTGMGDSDYRYEYHGLTYAEEIKAVCDAAGLGNDVFLVAHSFGGFMAVKAVNVYPDRFAGLILVDSGIRSPDAPPKERPPMGGRPVAYPDRETAENRFRLQPPQPCANEYLLKYIARHSLMPVDGGGLTWKFDTDLPESLKGVERSADDYRNLKLKVGLIYGELSESFDTGMLDYMRELIPSDFPAVAIADAYHHVFLDQPLKFVEVLREMLTALRAG